MTLADREYQRAHRNDPADPHPPPHSNGWLWLMAVIAVLLLLSWHFHWLH